MTLNPSRWLAGTALAVSALMALLPSPTANAENWVEGTHYEVLPFPVKTPNADQVEVVELFWYGCPHCFRLEPAVESWKATIDGSVDFKQVPAVLGRSWEPHARAFWTAKALNVSDKVHQPIFNAIHLERQRLVREDDVRELFARYGVSEGDFNSAWRSFGVESRLKQTESRINAYGIDGVPAFIVNGKYRITETTAGGQAQLFNVINYLIEKEKAQG